MHSPSLLLPYLLFMSPSIGLNPSFNTEQCAALHTASNLRPCNRVFNTALPSDREIEHIKTFFGDIPFTWAVKDDDVPLMQALERHNLSYSVSFPAMSVQLGEFTQESYDADIVIKHLDSQDPAALAQWITIVAEAFHTDRAEYTKVIKFFIEHTAPHALKFYIGYYQEIPAAVGLTFCHADGIATMHFIGTLPAYRGKGLGTALTHAALLDLQAMGYTHALLLASLLGKPLYDRLGFKEYATYIMYGNY